MTEKLKTAILVRLGTPREMMPSASINPEAGSASDSLVPRRHVRVFILVTALFFMWGIPHNLNDVLIRQFMKSFLITRFQAGLVKSAFYLGYFFLALPAGLVMKRFGYEAGMLVGLLLFAAGDFLFFPAAVAGRYSYFLVALFIIASGLALLETAANPFIAQLGRQAESERRLNLSQAFNPLGAITGVIIGTLFIFSGIELDSGRISAMKIAGTYSIYLRSETLRVVTPYIVLGFIALALAAVIAKTEFPAPTLEKIIRIGEFRSAIARRRLTYAVFAQFMYVGAQASTWSYFIAYVLETDHSTEKTAGGLLTVSLVAFLIGRFGSSFLMRFIDAARLVQLYAVVNIILVSVGIVFPNKVGTAAILLSSFFMAPMFPTLFAVGIKDFGEGTKTAASLLVMSAIGGAILTPMMGWVATQTMSIATAYLVPLCAYVCIGVSLLFVRRMEDNARYSTRPALHAD